ncbi:hypothetical protein PMIT1327_00344 [Prochlorococcus marinus str. MIT 1327]|nr:hypothetical protein PMIT1312_00077 [Prochlorococcus marinus str. MIT 1312]KZR83574.1 hypothetical protein PMIT1327_00344 [Prochlorococcus marinus str. MIT 1327]
MTADLRRLGSSNRALLHLDCLVLQITLELQALLLVLSC